VSAVAVISEKPPALRIVSALTLLRDFKPIEAIIDGIPAGRGALVSITAPTGHGKTTVSALMQVSLCRGLKFAGRDVTCGSVLVLAGENPDDYTMHLAATTQDQGIDGADLSRLPPLGQLLVVPGTFDVAYEMEALITQIRLLCKDDLVAVFVDTSAAFYCGDDENDNVAMRRHASALRELTTLPGKPTVFVLSHPTKNAQRESLLPRGGGAFLAEVDANLTLWKDETGIITLHWCGKIRGSSFDPIRFELAQIELQGFKDVRGRPIFSVAARHLPEERAEQLQAKELDDGNRLMLAMLRKPDGSMAAWALACGFTSGVGAPQKSRVSRLLAGLVSELLVEKGRGGTYRLTAKGKREAERQP
jgi:AAA domain